MTSNTLGPSNEIAIAAGDDTEMFEAEPNDAAEQATTIQLDARLDLYDVKGRRLKNNDDRALGFGGATFQVRFVVLSVLLARPTVDCVKDHLSAGLSLFESQVRTRLSLITLLRWIMTSSTGLRR